MLAEAQTIDRSNSVTAAEWDQRVKLAAVYRAFGRMGWDDMIYTHISARVPGPEHHFLINPFGLMYEEVTASSLVKIDLEGNKVDPDEPHEINYAGYIIHSAVHEAREDAKCVVHLHTDHGVAVSCQKDGLQPVSQFNLFHYGGVGYHDYEGLALDADEKQRLVADLGERNMMILRNHGTLTVGETVGEAFFNMYNLERACKIQVMAQAGGNDGLIQIPDDVMDKYRQDKPVGTRLGHYGDVELAAWMRKLDREEPDYRQ
jgi:ribulose-5-phosphate 4-epimerase/fuculose-1-phosphate aldolase